MDGRVIDAPAAPSASRETARRPWRERFAAWRAGLIANPKFQAWAAKFPLTRGLSRDRARSLFDLCAGFVYTQILFACVRLNVFERLAEGFSDVDALADSLELSPERARILLDGAVSLGLLTRLDRRYGLGDLGAALLANPGVVAMIEHHAMLYADLRDPVALLRTQAVDSELSRYWPYASTDDPAALSQDRVAAYSKLMAASQPFIASEVTAAYRFDRHKVLLDVGGGEGAFVSAVAPTAPDLELRVFDLPAVADRAEARFAELGLSQRSMVYRGDFYKEALPQGADIISLIRVLYDHTEDGVLSILRSVYAALPPGGVLIVAEPMAGAPSARAMGDAYFGFYLLAMGRGQARTPHALKRLIGKAGFKSVKQRPTNTPVLTGVIVAQR
ncbi:MAG: methyltransferase [Maricaulaceae bacterium]